MRLSCSNSNQCPSLYISGLKILRREGPTDGVYNTGRDLRGEDSSDLHVIAHLNVKSLNKISLQRKLGRRGGEGGEGGGGGGRNLDDVYCLLPDFIRVQLLNNNLHW